MIEWTPDMSVGCDGLDDDHKHLIEILNRYVGAMDHDDGVLVIDPIFGELISYMENHFRREEAVMEACGYDDIEHHKRLHQALEKHLFEMREHYMQTASGEVLKTIHDFLTHWLQTHIRKEDIHYKDAIVSNLEAANAALESLEG